MEEKLTNHSERIEELYKHMGLYNGKVYSINDSSNSHQDHLVPSKVGCFKAIRKRESGSYRAKS